MLKLNSLFSDRAILQRDMTVPVWGCADPYAVITIEIDSIKLCTVTNNIGLFRANLPAHPAGGPYEMTVFSKTDRITISDVYFGEVWLAGGQSNMEMPLTGFNVPLMSQDDLDALEFPKICHMMCVRKIAVTHSIGNADGEWLDCSQHENFSQMSADASFFARKLSKELGDIPVGIISSNWGGTYAEAWTSREALAKLPDFVPSLENYEKQISKPGYLAFNLDYTNAAAIAPVDAVNLLELERYFNDHPEVNPVNEPDYGYQLPDCDDADWKTGTLPCKAWTRSHDIKSLGVVWFRKEIQIPAAWEGHALTLKIGAVDKQDVTYFNGVKVGETGSGFETGNWCQPRKYIVPADLSKAGRAVIAVRAYSFLFDGGMIGPKSEMFVSCPEVDEQTIPLDGIWKAKQSIDFGSIPVACLSAIAPSNDHQEADGTVSNCGLPSSGIKSVHSFHILFDSMIAPLIPYAIRGVIWYQGCNNECYPKQYEEIMTALINDWRTRWNQPKFYFIQTLLAGYNKSFYKTWPLIRQAQMNAAKATDTAFVSAMDLGDADDIHPLRKQAVGERTANIALTIAYGRDIEAFGPQPAAISRKNGEVRIELAHADGLHAKEGAAQGFEWVSEDGTATSATPKIEGKSLVFANVPANAVKVRYAWDNYPVNANCYNGVELPMVPFELAID